MGWGGDMFPGTVWAYTDLHKQVHSDKPTRKTDAQVKVYVCIKKDKKTCNEKDKLTHM